MPYGQLPATLSPVSSIVVSELAYAPPGADQLFFDVSFGVSPGEHAAIINQTLWDKVQSILQESPRVRGCRARAATPALLKGLLFGPTAAP